MFRNLAAVLAFLAGLCVIPSASAQALPARASVLQELDRLEKEISVLDEEFNLARIRLARVEQQIRDLIHTKETADSQVSELRSKASSRAISLYKVGLPGVLLAFLESRSITEFNRRMNIASKVGDWEDAIISDLQIANERADARSEELEAELTRAKAIRASLNSRRDSLQKKIEEQKALLSRISSAELAVARASRAPKVRPVLVIADLPASASARIAVQTAYEQIGKPYRWGAAGPDSFDCSGLTMFAWRKAGVGLPHSSRAQFSATKRVARENLQPGDLVFFGSPIHHVGIYIGNGNMINSPESGEHVGIRSMARRDYAGAGRPGV